MVTFFGVVLTVAWKTCLSVLSVVPVRILVLTLCRLTICFVGVLLGLAICDVSIEN